MVLLVETKQYPTKDLVMRLSRVSLVELSLRVWIFFVLFLPTYLSKLEKIFRKKKIVLKNLYIGKM